MPELDHPAVSDDAHLEFRYRRSASTYDEMTAADGQVRPHWRAFADQVRSLGLAGLRRRWAEARDLIRENGVTYNVYGDPRGMDRPWELDPIPLLIAPVDARRVEAGLVQRATLLDRILADLHGPRRLLSSGALPADLIFGHPKFLRPCLDLKVRANRYLHLYAADVGRSPDGSFFVLADRTQAPSGAGYALENRIVLSRMLPEAFRDCQVHRLAGFFRTFRDSLRAIAPHDRDNPRVVLLTPGPYNETYFEHAYLARYLGYILAEGSDLTVRDNRVYLKLLGGLQPVDVILRRLDDDFCDPLELRRDSFLGVPGLVQAIREGNVAMANALGSGLMESPAMLAYLPRLCRTMLGEDLKLPSAPTWWCGDPGSLDHVLAHLGRMVIKPAFGSGRFGPIFGEGLSIEGRRALAEQIRGRPADYVGQEQLRLSTAPALQGDDLTPRHLVIRHFLASTGSGYAFMPGGLTRIASTADNLVVSMQEGGGSKDTWVLSDGPVDHFSLLPAAVQPVELRRDGGDLPSRSADDLYWLGRHVERVEGRVRLARGLLIRLADQPGSSEVPELPALLEALAGPSKGPGDRPSRIEEGLASILFDRERAGSLAESIQGLHRVAAKVRDRLSTDLWRIVNGLELGGDVDGSPGAIREVLDDRLFGLAAFGGLVAESMTRGQGWRFLDMGRRLERSLWIIDLLRLLVTPGGPEGSLLEALLLVADSTMTYRRRYMNQLQAAPVLDLLLADEANPRSVAFQLAALAESIEQLPRNEFATGLGEPRRVILTALTRLRVADVEQLAQVDEHGRRPGLRELLGLLDREIPALNDALTRGYFSHLQLPRQFSGSVGGPGAPVS